MKIISFLSLATISIMMTTACGQTHYDDYYSDEAYYDENYGYDEQGAPSEQGAYQAEFVSNDNGNDKIIMHSLVDPKTSMVTSQMPLPANWKVTSKGITGPNGIEAKDYPGASLQGRQIHSIDQIIQTDIAQLMRRNNAQQLRVIDLPEVARCDQRMMANYWSAMPTQKLHWVKGVEFKDAEGKLGILVVHLVSMRSQYGNTNFYYLSALTANPSHYESAKKAFLYGISNIKQNLEYLALYNRNEQQKSQVAWNNHNARMRSNQAAFNSFQQTQSTLSEIGDIYHQGYQERSAIRDRSHANVVDGILGQQTVTNPYNNQQVQVEYGYDNYYMNSNNEYIGTDDAFYNPNMDNTINNQEWQRIENAGGGY